MSLPKFFNSDMLGAPVLTGLAGTVVGLLDAVLINGFGLVTPTSMVASGGVVTMGLTAGHTFHYPTVIQVTGSSIPELNGEWRIKSSNSLSATFEVPGADGVASGAQVKVAPLGWTKVFSGPNTGCYKPSDVEASSAILRVADGGTQASRVLMYESMSDVDTGVNPAPPASRFAYPGLYWWKSSTTNSVVRKWTVIGDSRNLFFIPLPYNGTDQGASASNVGTIYHFGDLISYKQADSFPGCLTGDTTAVSSGSCDGNAGFASSGVSTQLVRGHTGVGGAVNGDRRPTTGSTSSYSGNDTFLGNFPSPANYGLYLSRMMVSQNTFTNWGPRGEIPGLLYVPQGNTNNGQFPRGQIVDGTGEFAGKKIYAVSQSGSALQTGTNDYAAFFDIEGPWR